MSGDAGAELAQVVVAHEATTPSSGLHGLLASMARTEDATSTVRSAAAWLREALEADAVAVLHGASNLAEREAFVDGAVAIDAELWERAADAALRCAALSVAGDDPVVFDVERRGVWLCTAPRATDDAQSVVVMVSPDRAPTSAETSLIREAAAAIAVMTAQSARLRALENAASRFQTLAKTIPGVVYQRVVRPDGDIRYTYISESAQDLFGVSADEILTNPRALFNSYAPEYRESFRQRLIEASKRLTTWDVEASILRPDGSTVYTHAIARPTRQEDGSVLWTGVILDASRIKEAERLAAETEARTKSLIVESIGQGFLMFDEADELVLWNSHYEQFYPSVTAQLKRGALYRDIIQTELAAGVMGVAVDGASTGRFDERLDLHRARENFVIEGRLPGEIWLQINEHRTENGETVVLHTDVSEIRRREERIHHMALHDALTGLPNRTYFARRLDAALAEAQGANERVYVMCIDLDNFKAVNDTLGHPAGDKLLCAAVRRIRNALGVKGVLARFGGDEFAVVLTGLSAAMKIEQLANRIIKTIAEPFDLDGQCALIGASIGIAFGDRTTTEAGSIVRAADMALYQAKADGKNTFRFFEASMGAQAHARRILEVDLRRALEDSQLEVHYQPQVDTVTEVLTGFEALVRWRHPDRGLVPPGEFIGLAEETGLINALGDFVLRTACSDAMSWTDDLAVAVNISPAQFRRNNLIEIVRAALNETGLAPHRLELEITESVLLRKTDSVMETLFSLKDLGVKIAMDDFGTGYSSLGNLRSFPFDRIKIDRSFVADIGKNQDATAIVRAVANLGVSLGIQTTAEGVKTIEQFNRVLREGCSHVQGFFYGRAVPKAEVAELIEKLSKK